MGLRGTITPKQEDEIMIRFELTGP